MGDEPVTMTTYKAADPDALILDYGWMTTLDWADELTAPVEVVKEVWVRQSEETITVGPMCPCGALPAYWGLCEKCAREDDPEAFGEVHCDV